MSMKARRHPVFPEAEADLGRRDSCRVCSGEHRPEPAVGRLTYVRCRSCGLVFMEPMPSQRWYDGRYAAEYWEGQAKRDDRADETSRRLRKEHLRAIAYAEVARAAGLPPEGTLLEIGCGTGGAAATLAEALGWSAAGVEPDVASRVIATTIGVTVDATDIDGLIAHGRTFGLILLSHVLEHVVDPDRFLTQVLRLLAPNGVLLIEVPNGMTNESLHLFHPYLFTRRALTTLLLRHGLQADVFAHGGAASRMRHHFLLAVARRGGRMTVRGMRFGRRLGQAWSRAWKRGRVLHRVDALLVRRSVRAYEPLLARWERALMDVTPE